MRLKFATTLFCAFALGLAAMPASEAEAQDIREVTLRSLSSATIASYDQGSVYAGPYGFQVGSDPGSPLWDFVCVDFAHRVSANQTFDAHFTSLVGGDLGETYLGQREAVAAQQRYLMSAYLIQKLNAADEDQYGAIHAAIWKVTGYDLASGVGYATGGDADSSQDYVDDAYRALASNSIDANGWVVVTDVDGTRQEFMTYVTPEPATMIMLGTGMAGMAWIRRRKDGVEVEEEEDLA